MKSLQTDRHSNILGLGAGYLNVKFHRDLGAILGV